MTQDAQLETAASENHTLENDAPSARESEDQFQIRLATMTVDDAIATALLRTGRALSAEEIIESADLPFNKKKLRLAVAHAPRVLSSGGKYDLEIRARWKSKTREERTRPTLERSLIELLTAIGKPLPLPVIVREVSEMRGVVPAHIKDALAQLLPSSPQFIQGANGAWMHVSFFLDNAAPSDEIIRRHNRLDAEPDWGAIENLEVFSDGVVKSRAGILLHRAARPLSLKLLGYLLWRADKSLSAGELARAIGDRETFHFYVGGHITTQAQKSQWNAAAAAWLDSLSDGPIDIDALLSTQIAPDQFLAPSAADLETLRNSVQNGAPLSVGTALLETLKRDDDPDILGRELHGLNAALHAGDDWTSVGYGRFVLTESLPYYIGETPEILQPVTLKKAAKIDVELSDDAFDEAARSFIHDAHWEDIGEEKEVHFTAPEAAPLSTQIVLTYPHHVAGTAKLRRMDEAFFQPSGDLTRYEVTALDDDGSEELAMWLDGKHGLIHGLVDWYSPRTPSSGAVLDFAKENGQFTLTLAENDALMFLDADRVEQLELLIEQSETAPLFQILQWVFEAHPEGAAIETLWAETNVIRRTTKRLLASLLTAYPCFEYSAKQARWVFNAEKVAEPMPAEIKEFIRR